jgi:hypothetical protein
MIKINRGKHQGKRNGKFGVQIKISHQQFLVSNPTTKNRTNPTLQGRKSPLFCSKAEFKKTTTFFVYSQKEMLSAVLPLCFRALFFVHYKSSRLSNKIIDAEREKEKEKKKKVQQERDLN